MALQKARLVSSSDHFAKHGKLYVKGQSARDFKDLSGKTSDKSKKSRSTKTTDKKIGSGDVQTTGAKTPMGAIIGVMAIVTALGLMVFKR